MIRLRTFWMTLRTFPARGAKPAEMRRWPDGGVVTQRTANPQARGFNPDISAIPDLFWPHGFLRGSLGDCALFPSPTLQRAGVR